MDVHGRGVRRPAVRSAVVIAAVVLAACGDDDAGAPGARLEEPTATAEVPASSTTTLDEDGASVDDDWRVEVEAVGCDQLVSDTRVDAAGAALFVPEGQEVWLNAQGLAHVILVVKRCDDFVVDGRSVGPGHMDTLWVRVPGPSEGLSLPDDPEFDGPTPDAFVPQFIQTDNAAYSDAVSAYGVPLLLADEMSADPPGTDERTGGAINAALSPPLSYEWTVTGSGSSVRSGLVNHLLRGTDVDGAPISYAIECSYTGGGGGPATVEFEPGGPFEALLGTGWSSRGVEMQIDCRIVIEPS
jgi:hypothetical protein